MYKANTNILILFSNRNRNPNSNNAPLPRRSNVPLILKSYRLDTPWQLYPKKIVSKKASVTVRYRRGSNSWKEILNLESWILKDMNLRVEFMEGDALDSSTYGRVATHLYAANLCFSQVWDSLGMGYLVIFLCHDLTERVTMMIGYESKTRSRDESWILNLESWILNLESWRIWI